MGAISTDIVDGVCAPDTVHGSERLEHVLGVFVAYLLPLILMMFFYTRVVIALRPKVR